MGQGNQVPGRSEVLTPSVIRGNLSMSLEGQKGHQAASLRGTSEHSFCAHGWDFGGWHGLHRWNLWECSLGLRLHLSTGLPSGSFLPTGLGSQALAGFSSTPGTCPHHLQPFQVPSPASNPINFYPLGSRWSLGGRERRQAWGFVVRWQEGSLVGWFAM